MALDINYDTLDVYHRTLSAAFNGALASAPPSEWERVATRIASGSKRNDYNFLGEVDSMRRWVGPRISRQLKSHSYSIVNEKFELTIDVDIDELDDDAGGLLPMYTGLAEIRARAVAVQPDELVMGEAFPGGETNLCYDGQFFFDTDHVVDFADATSDQKSNHMAGSGTAWYLLDTSKPLKPFIFQDRLAPELKFLGPNSDQGFTHDKVSWGVKRRNAAGYGLWQSAVISKQTLDETNLQAAILRMNSYVNDEGRKLGMNPNLLVVPQSLNFVARDLLDFRLGASSSGTGAENRAYGMVPYMVSNYL
jgi:phage major head subunit gpT-like protein